MTKPLTENRSRSEAKIILEEGDDQKDGRKKLYMAGIFISGGVRNHNQRIYPVHEIKSAVEKINHDIKEGSVCGELDHPEELMINLDRVSHTIEKMWMDGNDGYGKLRILPTPCGTIARSLIESEVRLGVSRRGSGNVDDRGNVSDFEIVTVDIVCKPSAPNAFPKPVYEAFNSRRGAIIEDLARAVADDPKAQRHFHKELISWIDTLK